MSGIDDLPISINKTYNEEIPNQGDSPPETNLQLRPPTNDRRRTNRVLPLSFRQISVHVERPLESGIVNHQQNQWGFQYEKVLSNASQEIVYNLSSKEILTAAL